MKMNRPVYFSIGFLFLFLTSFSTNTVISLNNSLKQIVPFSKNKQVTPDAAAAASEDLVFEETEDDCEDSINPLQTTLPSYLNFEVFIQKISLQFSDLSALDKRSNSLFLAIRVIRI